MAEQQSLYDQWQHPAGDIVWLPSTNREQYLRQPGFSLLAEDDFDFEQQRAADADAARWRGLREDVHPMPSGPTAYFPAGG